MSKYIKLDDAIDAKCPVEDIWKDCIDCPLDNKADEPCKMGKWLKSLPTIEVSEDAADTPMPKEGEWRGEHKMPDMPRYEWYRCSECSFLSHAFVNYCPNCGAKMKGAEE